MGISEYHMSPSMNSLNFWLKNNMLGWLPTSGVYDQAIWQLKIRSGVSVTWLRQTACLFFGRSLIFEKYYLLIIFSLLGWDGTYR